MKNKILFILLNILFVLNVTAQNRINDCERFIRYFVKENHDINVLQLSSPDMYYLESKDRERDELMKVRTSAVILPVNTNFFDISTVINTEYGYLYTLKITSNDALALNILSDDFHIPQGDVLMLLSQYEDAPYISYTYQDNTTDGMFMSGYVYGDTLILAYMKTKQSSVPAKLNLQGAGYFYRDISYANTSLKGFGSSGSCEVNVNCEEGSNFQNQKNSVVRMMIPVNSLEIAGCTGTLINNTDYDRKPYIISAAHCIEEMVSMNYMSQVVFYFNYEGDGCSKPKKEPSTSQTRTGATLLAYDNTFGSTAPDYMLLLLNQNIPESYGAYWSGWNKTEDLLSGTVCIHHPAGDIKKISTVDGAIEDKGYEENLWDYYTHCMVRWKKTKNGYGVTEGGSSGASLFDAEGRILGILSGGLSSCSESAFNRVDWFGRLCYFFDAVKQWLDPSGTGLEKIDGMRWPLDIRDTVQKHDFDYTVYPVPATDYVYVDLSAVNGQSGNITVTDNNGRIVYNNKVSSVENILVLDISGWAKGVYYINVASTSGNKVKKIICE